MEMEKNLGFKTGILALIVLLRLIAAWMMCFYHRGAVQVGNQQHSDFTMMSLACGQNLSPNLAFLPLLIFMRLIFSSYFYFFYSDFLALDTAMARKNIFIMIKISLQPFFNVRFMEARRSRR